MRNFVAFLQHPGEIGKTLAEMSIERYSAGDHNEKHQADRSLPSY
ncbi:hypothetical protein ECK5_22310 [Escherichia coli O10:K5(L):H4 str. ATCC 23506]|nr:hypothetical protein ECK5_22310 [Escherichia coli O10:K5(L):H4 str. ATCC 23506]